MSFRKLMQVNLALMCFVLPSCGVANVEIIESDFKKVIEDSDSWEIYDWDGYFNDGAMVLFLNYNLTEAGYGYMNVASATVGVCKEPSDYMYCLTFSSSDGASAFASRYDKFTSSDLASGAADFSDELLNKNIKASKYTVVIASLESSITWVQTEISKL